MLLLLPLLNRQWRALVPAFVVPAVVNAAAWPLVADPMDFITKTLPYIGGTRDYFNSSIEGNGVRLPIRFATCWSIETPCEFRSAPVVRAMVVPVSQAASLT